MTPPTDLEIETELVGLLAWDDRRWIARRFAKLPLATWAADAAGGKDASKAKAVAPVLAAIRVLVEQLSGSTDAIGARASLFGFVDALNRLHREHADFMDESMRIELRLLLHEAAKRFELDLLNQLKDRRVW